MYVIFIGLRNFYKLKMIKLARNMSNSGVQRNEPQSAVNYGRFVKRIVLRHPPRYPKFLECSSLEMLPIDIQRTAVPYEKFCKLFMI